MIILKQFENHGFDDLKTAVWVYDVTGYRIFWANQAAIELWEASSLDELRARDFYEKTSEAVQKTLLSYLEDFEQGLSIDRWWRISPKGINKHVLCRFSGIKIEEGQTAMFCEASDSEMLYIDANGVRNASIVSLFDEQGRLCSHNSLFTEQFGYGVKRFEELFNESIDWVAVASSDDCALDWEMLLKTRSGLRWHKIELRQQISPDSKGFIATLIDVHDRKERELIYVHDSLSDPLTGLRNHRGLEETMNGKGDEPYTLYYIDLDGFKPINDSFGYGVGDLLLQKVASVLVQSLDDNAVFSRIGGDEFIVVIPGEIDEAACQITANTIVRNLSEPMLVGDARRVIISASVGVSRFPDDGDNIDALLTNADAAMYLAKKRGRNRWVRYTAGMEEHLRRRTLIAQNLTDAISNDHLTLHYQPIIDSSTGTAVLAEALLRWDHPLLGPVPPQEIIFTAEEIGRINCLENWIIRRACKDVPQLKQQYGDQCRVSINISGADINDDEFSKRLLEIVIDEGLRPADILLELTEDILVTVLESGHNSLDFLKNEGFSFAIDDFGTGYSSLAYLSEIPASYVKIDKAFIDNLNRDLYTVQFIRDLCGKLNMKCIAEGMEERSQAETLSVLDITLHQGYYYAKPEPLLAIKRTKASHAGAVCN